MEEIAVRAAPDEVFAYIADSATLPEWCGVAGELVPVEGTVLPLSEKQRTCCSLSHRRTPVRCY
jgi:hypothetical protein